MPKFGANWPNFFQNSLKKKDTYFLLKSSLDLGHTADVANSILEYSVLIATFALLHSYFD